MPQQVESLPVDELARRVSQTLAPRAEVQDRFYEVGEVMRLPDYART